MKNSRRKYSLGVMLCTTIVGMIIITLQTKNGIKPISDDPRSDVTEKYRELMSNISQTNVCPGIHPVHIFREENGVKLLHATGVQFDGDKTIITCGHAFWDIPGKHKTAWKFYYQVLEPMEHAFHPINRIVVIDKVAPNTPNPSMDVIACIPGPAEYIAPLRAPPQEIQGGKEHLTFTGIAVYEKPQVARSTVTGEEIKIIGTIRLMDGPSYYVLACKTFATQSGTFYASADNKKGYILSRTLVLTKEIREAFGLDTSHTMISLCASVNLNQ